MLRRSLVLAGVAILSVGVLASPAWAPPHETGCFGLSVQVSGTDGNDTLYDPQGGNHSAVIDGRGEFEIEILCVPHREFFRIARGDGSVFDANE